MSKRPTRIVATEVEQVAGTPRRRVLKGRAPAPLALEPRIMFDAALADAVVERTTADVVRPEASVRSSAVGIDPRTVAALSAPVPAEAQRSEIVFIEDNVADFAQLVAGVRPGVEVIVLDHTGDGLQQMLAALDGRAPVDAIHLVTHGSAGQIDLGASRITGANLDSYQAQLAQLGQALNADGDFLIYGCDVAATGEGGQLVSRMAALTGADVAASTDTTGAAVFGGDWDLEEQSGAVDTDAMQFEGYAGTLGVNAINTIAGDNRVNAAEAASVTISGTVTNSGATTLITVTDGTRSVTASAATGTSSWTATLNLSTLSDGPLTIYTKQANNGTASSSNMDLSMSIVKDTTAPAVSISGPGSTITTSNATFNFTGTDNGTGVARYEYQLDSTSGAWTSTTSTSVSLTLPSGSHTLYMRAVDAAGNTTATPASYTLYVDTVVVNSAPTASGTVTLAPISDSTTNPAGATVSSLFGSRFADANGDTMAGIAIVSYARDSSAGEWQYNSGSGWVSIGSSLNSASAAFTLKSTDQLRFVPANGFSGSAPALAVKLVDSGVTVTSGATVDATGGGTTHYSADSVTLKTAVQPSYSLSSPDSKFVTLLSGSGYDPFDDTQSQAADTDLVGHAGAPLLMGGYDSNSGDLYYRVRIGNPTLAKGVPTFTGVVLLGVDTNSDGKLDVFIGVDGRNNGLGVVTFAPGNDLNTSPSTSSIANPQSVIGASNRNYTYNLTGGDIGGDGKGDAYLTFSLPFNVLAARVAALTGQTLTPSSSMSFVLLTATQNNAINGDIGGIGSLTKAQKSMSWTDLGLLRTMNMTAPTISGIAGNFQFTENGSPVALAPTATFSDADSTNFSGGKLEVTISGNPDSGKDVLALNAGGVTAANGVVSVGGTQVGTYSFVSNVLTVNFTAANVTADHVNAVLRAISFSNNSDAPSTANRTVQFKLTDGQNNASAPNLSKVTVVVAAVNDAPGVSATPTALNRTVTSGTTYDVGTATTANAVILASGANSALSVSDIDAASGTVSVTLGVDKGVLQLYSGTTLQTGSVTIDGVTISGSRTGALVLSGTVANINALLAGSNASSFKVLYQPGMNATGSATLSLTVNDQGNTGSGGARTASSTVGTITIAQPAPTGTLAGGVIEDNAVSNGNLTATGTISAPITGVTFLGNTRGVAQLGTLTYENGTWTYTVSNSNATVQALTNGQSILESFEVQTSSGSVFVRVSIDGVNDAPTLTVTNGSGSFTENGPAVALFDSASATLGGLGAAAESGQVITNLTLDVTNVFDGDKLVIDGTAFYLDQQANGVLTASGYTVTISLSGTTATVTIGTAQATASAIESLVTGLAYQSASDNPTNYGANGSRTLTLTSLKDSGGTVNGGADQAALNLSRTVSINASNDAPAVNVAPVTLNQNSTATVGIAVLIANDPDTDPASLVYTVTSAPGKGTIKLNGVATTTFTQQDINDGKVTYTAGAYGSDQTDAFVVSVSDGTNTVSGTTVDVNIITANYAPSSADATVTTPEDTNFVFGTGDFAFNDFNTGDSISAVELVTLPVAGTLQVYVNGGWQNATASQQVSAADLAAGNLRFVPVANASGTPYGTLTFKVLDQSGAASGEAMITIAVTPVNDLPVGANTAISTPRDVASSGSLPVATDAENEVLTYSKATDPSHGTATINANGTYTYTPSPNYSGSDSFTYTVTDASGGSRTYTVDVTVVGGNRAPAAANTAISTTEDTAHNGTLPAATDADGDAVTYAVGTGPSHGSVTVNADGSYVYTPSANYNGSDSFSYTVSDINGGSATYTVDVTVTPAKDTPVAADLAVSTTQGTAKSGSLPAATDADNDAVTYTKATDPAHGTATVGSDGSYTYTPAAGFSGSDSFTYTVSDANGGSNTYTVTITVSASNQAPVGSGTSIATGEDTLATGSLPVATDADNDEITYAVATGPANGTVTVNADGTYTYTPVAHFNGNDSFTYTVSDANGGSNTYTVNITVTAANDNPTAANATVTTNEDTAATGTLPGATDIDGDTVTYTVGTGPSNGTVTVNADGTYTYTPTANYNGSDSFTYTVTDSNGGSNTYTVDVTVNPVNDKPTAANATVTTNEDTAASGTLPGATDIDGDTVTYAVGTGPSNGTVTVNADGTYTYTPAANYNGADSFTYTVTDSNGGSNTYTVNVTVNPVNDKPTAANATVTTNEDTAASGTLPGATDIDGDTVTYAVGTGPSNGSVTVNADGTYTYAPTANYNGADSFTYTVTDSNGSNNTYTVNVTVNPVNDKPVAGDTAFTTSEDVAKSGTLPAATDADGDAVTYTVAAGPANGTVTVNADGTYTYTPTANYNGSDSFTYTVSDSNGGSNTYTVSITVGPVNNAPVAANATLTTAEDTVANATLPAATDVDGDAVTYAVATGPSNGSVTVNADGTYTYTPAANFNGTDSFTYTVSDPDGGSNTYTVNITVTATNDNPTAANATVTTNEDTSASGTLPGATDIDGDTVTYAVGTGPSNGAVTVNADGTYTYTPTANYNGNDSFTYTVTDPSGGSNTYTVNVTVNPVNDKPVAGDTAFTTPEDVAKTGTLPTATDVDGDAVTYAVAAGPANGTVTVNADGTYTYTPTANYNGADSFTYTVSDSNGGSNTYTVSITVGPVNNAPVAANATLTTAEDTAPNATLPAAADVDGDVVTYAVATGPSNGSVTVNADGTYTYTPAANFNGTDSFTYTVSDPDGGSNTYTVNITVTAVNDKPTAANATVTTNEDTAASGTLPGATDIDGDSVTYAVGTGPSNGTVTVNADGTYTYTPAANYNGSDSFTYTVTDSNGGSNTYTVNVTVDPVNDKPTAGNTTVTTNEDTATGGTLPVATDIDGDTVTYAVGTGPLNGTVTVNADGTYTYTPTANYNGADSFTYTVTDSSGGSNTYTVNIAVNPVNDKPVAGDTAFTTSEDVAKSGTLPGATDADGDAVTYAVAAGPANGTVTVNADGTYTYTPTANYNGSDNFTYTVSDSNGGSNTYTVSITVGPVNNAPVAANATLTTAEDTVANAMLPAATDVDGDAVTYAVATGPSNGSVTVNADGTYTYTPAANFNGTDSFTYTVSDPDGGSNTYTVNITVTAVNDKPTAANATVTTNEDTAASGTLPSATDIDGDTVTYAVGTGPSNGTVSVNADGTYTYTPTANYNGSDSFTYTVTDSNGGSNAYTVNVTVNPVNDKPVAGDTAVTTPEDVAKTGTLPAATDADGNAVTYTVAGSPAHGTVTIGVNGSYVYTPSANYNGTDSFTYTVSDSSGGSNTYTVSVTVVPVNDAPVAADATLATLEETPVTGKLPAASDVDGDAITYTVGTQASNGTVTINADGTFTYTPAADFAGADSFTFTISDGNGGNNTYTVSVTVAGANDAPVSAEASFTLEEDSVLPGVLPTVLDRDGDKPSYSLATPPAHGSVTVNADGTFVYAPVSNYNGPDGFSFAVSDGKGGSNTYTVSLQVTPVNDAPVASGGATVNATAGQSMPPVSVPLFTDVDSPVITYTAAQSNGDPLPSWLGFDPVSLRFSGTPPVGAAGSVDVTVTGSDGSLSASTSVTIVIGLPEAPRQSISIGSMTRDTGTSASDFITSDGGANRTVSGSLDSPLGKDEVVQVSFDGGASWATASVSGNGWSVVDGGAHSENWTIVARVHNTATGVSGAAAQQDVKLDLTKPAAPTVNTIVAASPTPVLSGSATTAPGETLQVSINGATYVVVPSGGSWTLDLATAVPVSGSASPLAPGATYNVTAAVSDAAGNSATDSSSNEVTVALPPVPPEVPPVPQQPAPTPAPVPVEVTPEPPPAPVTQQPSTPDPVAPGSVVGNDSVNVGSGNPIGRTTDAPFELQLTRAAELSDVYTRSEGFRTVVAPAEQPALVLFQGVPDQYIEAGTRLSVTVPADAFAHTQPKAIVRLAATLQDGRPLPAWVQFNGQTGQFYGQVPEGVTGELRIKLIARDQAGREATALFRVNVGTQKGVVGKVGLTEQLRQTSKLTGARLAQLDAAPRGGR